MAHDGAAEIGAFLPDEVADRQRQPLVATRVNHQGRARLALGGDGGAHHILAAHWGPQASAIASMATSTPGMSAPKRTIARAGFGPGKNSAYASFISL